MMMTKIKQNIGFMQGRFSAVVNNRIQSFPWDSWRQEFAQAQKYGFQIMEWVIEQERLAENPIMQAEGRKEIKKLMAEYRVMVPSVTMDTFIQEPFYKAQGDRLRQLLDEFEQTMKACREIGITRVVVPLVDLGTLETGPQEALLRQGLDRVLPTLKDGNMIIVFESDYESVKLRDFIGSFDEKFFGVNYDIGNSASLGFDFKEEIAAYGKRIKNVHVKDRALHGTTVPLGEGNADLPGVLTTLAASGYNGNYILQTARDAQGRHEMVLPRYRDLVADWLK